MKTKFLFGIIWTMTLVHLTAQNQQLKFSRINILEDASIGQVNFITEDENGFIWMSEQSGGALIRFDGHHIKRYSFNPGEENSLGGSYPECLLIDKEGFIWIGFGAGFGLDRFDPVTESFKHFRHDPYNPNSLSNNTVPAVLQDREGKIYVATFDGMDILDPETGVFTHFKHDPNDSHSLSSNYVREIYEDHSGTIWVGTGWFTGDSQGGLNRFDKMEGKFVRYMADSSNPNALRDNRITAIFEDSRNRFWVGTGEALYSLDRKKEIFTRHQSAPKDPDKLGAPFFSNYYYGVTFISEDQDGNLWVGGEGVNVYNPKLGTMVHFGGNSDSYGTFIEKSSWCIHMGTNGLIWLSTQPGVYQIDPFNFTIPVRPGMIPSLTMESDSIIWSGSDNGLLRINEITGSQEQWTHNPSDSNTLSSNSILSLLQDPQGNLWIGTSYGLNKLNYREGKVTRFFRDPQDSSSISGNTVRAIVQDENGILWIGSDRGLDKFDQISGKFEAQPLRSGNGGNVTSISTMITGEKNILWIGEFASGSILKYDVVKKESTFYPLANGANDLYRDHQQTIWAAAPSGLYRYDAEIDRFIGLSHVPMISIIEDFDSNLWASSVSDIFRINRNRDNIIKYNGQDVTPFRALNAIKASGYLRKNGEIVMGDAEHYFVFDPKKIIIPPDTSRLIFTNLWLGVDQMNNTAKSGIFDNRDLTLAYDQNTFSLSFTEIDPRNPKGNKINYLLTDYDFDWRECFAEEKITYLNIPPGTYTFRIKASNSSTGTWVENHLNITIFPPWWATWWAYAIYVSLFMMAVWQIHRVLRARTIRQEKERTRERELAQAKEIEKAYNQLQATQAQLIHSEKMASLGELTAGIAHEIQNPLNFVNNFSEVNKELYGELETEIEKGDKSEIIAILKDLKENEEKVIQHGKRAEAIVKSMLQHSRTSSGSKELSDVNALCDEYIRLSYHGMRARDKSFNVSINTAFERDLPKINLVPQEIGRVLLNILNNAFQAVQGVPNPEVSISTNLLNHQIQILITDNGIGIPGDIRDKIFQPFFTTKPTGQGTGLGLSLSYDIVKVHGGEIKVDSEEGKGSKFIIQLPVV